jgi:hypothetical protein
MNADAIRVFQPALRTNRTLKALDLSVCLLRDEGLHLIVDALVGNTTMEKLDIRTNEITSHGQDDITLLLESTHLKEIDFRHNVGIYTRIDNATRRRFAHTLAQNETLQRLSIIYLDPERAMMIICALHSNTALEEMHQGDVVTMCKTFPNSF